MISSSLSSVTPSPSRSMGLSHRPSMSRYAKALFVLAASSAWHPMTASGFTPMVLRGATRAPLTLMAGLGGGESSRSDTDTSFESKYETLTNAFKESAWRDLAENNFDLITVLTGQRAGCSLSPRLLPQGVTVVNRNRPIVSYNGNAYHSDVFYNQAFIFNRDAIIKLMQEAGLPTEDIRAGGGSPFQLFESFSPKHLETYQRERILGFSHAIDTLNSEVCGSFCEYINSGDIIVSQSMLGYSKAQGWISDADIETMLKTVESGRLRFEYSDSNFGFRLPAPLSDQRQMMLLSASEFDFGADGVEGDEYIDEGSAFDPIDERALDRSGSTHLLLKKLYARWETLFDRVTRMPKGLPKVTAYGKSLGRRNFVEPVGDIDEKFIRLHSHFQTLQKGDTEMS